MHIAKSLELPCVLIVLANDKAAGLNYICIRGKAVLLGVFCYLSSYEQRIFEVTSSNDLLFFMRNN